MTDIGTRQRLYKASKGFTQNFDVKSVRIAGTLGVTDNGPTEILGRDNYTWIRLANSEAAPIYNQRVPNIAGLKVWVGYTKERPELLQVLDLQETFSTPMWNGSGPHGFTHEWPNQDTIWIRGEQYLPGLITPYSGTIVNVYPMPVYETDGWNVHSWQLLDLAPYSPVTGALWAVIEYGATGALQVRTGGWASTPELLTDRTIPAPSGTVLGAVALYNQDSIRSSKLYSDIVDLRHGATPSSSGGGIPEAPIDGKIYGRKNAAWSEVSGSGGGGLTNPVDYIDFNVSITGTPGQEGRLIYSPTDGTLHLGLAGGTSIDLGQDVLVPRRVKNTSGSPMTKGQLVYISGGDGNNVYVSLAKADSELTSANTLAMLDEDIANNQFGWAVIIGIVIGTAAHPIDTSSYPPGTILYLSSTVSGGWTSSQAISPNHNVKIGQVFRQHATEGSIIVHIDNGYELSELHDVLISGLTGSQVLAYNFASGTWMNTNLGSINHPAGGDLSGTYPNPIVMDDSHFHTTGTLPDFPRWSQISGSYLPSSGWIPVFDVWTRTGNHTFIIPGDVTATYRKGTKVRYKDSGAFEYGVILSATYGAPNTTINLIPNTDYTMAAVTITDTFLSYIQNPEGFPFTFNYSATWNNLFLGNGTAYSKWQTDGRHIHNRAGFVFGSTTAITGTLNLVPIITPVTLGTTQEHFGEATIRDTGAALYNGTVYLIGGNLYPQVSNVAGVYSAPVNITAIVPQIWANTDELSVDCFYDF